MEIKRQNGVENRKGESMEEWMKGGYEKRIEKIARRNERKMKE